MLDTDGLLILAAKTWQDLLCMQLWAAVCVMHAQHP
jgi:hypothetical protein